MSINSSRIQADPAIACSIQNKNDCDVRQSNELRANVYPRRL